MTVSVWGGGMLLATHLGLFLCWGLSRPTKPQPSSPISSAPIQVWDKWQGLGGGGWVRRDLTPLLARCRVLEGL